MQECRFAPSANRVKIHAFRKGPFADTVKMQESGGLTDYTFGKMYTVLALWKSRPRSAPNGGKIACFAVKEKPSTLAWHVAGQVGWAADGWLAGRQTGRLAGRLAGWLAGWQAGWLAGWLAGRLASGRLAGGQAGRWQAGK